jgi:aminoglycoside phosphotransferase (APT) family kinase protein
MGSIGTPKSELIIDTDLVLDLLQKQHPDLSHLSIQLHDSGWDNVMFRLGNRLSVRLPRREIAASLIVNEQTWLPEIANNLTIPVPTPYRIGAPTSQYPWQWSILPWLTGVAADQEKLNSNQARQLALFLRSLHLIAAANAPLNSVRGVPLKKRATAIEQRIQRLENKVVLKM